MNGRRYWRCDLSQPNAPLEPADIHDYAFPPNLIGSLTEQGTHRPVLDIDFEAHLEPSSTPGHYHLYLDGLELDWAKYARLIGELAQAGVVSWGYAVHSLERGQTLARLPWVKKEDEAWTYEEVERADDLRYEHMDRVWFFEPPDSMDAESTELVW